MKLENTHKQILKSFSSISEQIYITSQIVGVTDPQKTLGAYYEWGVEIPEPYGVPNIVEFLSIIDMYNDPTVIKDNKNILISEGKKKNKYVCLSEASIIKPIAKQTFIENVLSKRTCESEFVLSKDQINDIRKNVNILKNTHLKFEGNSISTFDKKINSNSDSENKFEMEIDGMNTKIKVIPSSNIGIIVQDDYKFKIYDSFIWIEAINNPIYYMFKLIAVWDNGTNILRVQI